MGNEMEGHGRGGMGERRAGGSLGRNDSTGN